MNTTYRRIAYTVAFALLGVYGFFTLRGPQGIPALIEKRTKIRQLEEENANLVRENEYKRERIRKLSASASQLDVEIRDKLDKVQPGETEFILPKTPPATPEANPPKGR